MATNYAQHVNPKLTPQTEALPGQQENNAGGYSHVLDVFDQLTRFLILGCEGGSYYAGERKLTIDNAQVARRAAKADPGRAVDLIVSISEEGRAIKNDPAIFALALLTTEPAAASRALAAMPRVCRTGTHLFQFVDAVNQLRGWGRSLRRAVSDWYLSKSPDQLAMQVTKYAQREGWSHRDVLRLSHPTTKDRDYNDVFQYVTQREKWLKSRQAGHRLLVSVEEARTATTPQLLNLILDEGLVREHIPSEQLNNPHIWDALLQDMPATAMIRNLGKMTSVGLLTPLSAAANRVAVRLRDPGFMKRVHPFSILLALSTYGLGHGFRGQLTWEPVPQVVDALNDAYYLAFGNIVPTTKRFLLGIDVSGSMGAVIDNTSVTCREAAGCMAMVALRTEPQCYAFGFTNRFERLNLSASLRLDQVQEEIHRSNFGRTDCAVPMTHALEQRIPVDVFCVYTDNETYAGSVHPSVALENYRQAMGIDAKLVVVGMTATEFTIADPNDPGMLDVAGFDADAPQAIAEFAR